jgi:C-terminal processing protease CtpA/Prc
MIHYFFPYKYLTDKNWNTILKEYIPLFIQAKNELEYELVATLLIGEVCDTHAGLWAGGDKIDSLRGNWQVPIQIQFVENKWVVKDYYPVSGTIYTDSVIRKMTGLEQGDVITHINDKPIELIVDSIKKYYPASNETARMRNIAYDLMRSNQPKLSIQLEREGKSITKTPGCYSRNQIDLLYEFSKNKPLIEILKPYDITYLYLASTMGGTVPRTIDSKGLIIDLRCYPKHDNIKGYKDYFLLYPHPTEYVKFTVGSVSTPGLFTFTGIEKVGAENPDYYKGKKVILINEYSQSHTEFMAMRYRCAPNTVVIGSTTAGADGNASAIILPGELGTIISGIGVYYPDGRETQRVGIVPDIEVKPTIRGIREGRDEVLEKAVEIIEQETKKAK